MDESRSAEEDKPQDREVVAESRYYLLVSTPDGWGVWDRTLPSDEPVAFYPAEDNSYDLAAEYFARSNRTARFRRWSIRNWSRLDVLRWVVYVSGVTWVITNAIAWTVLQIPAGSSPFVVPSRLVQALDGVVYPIFLVSVGAYVVTWLRSRERP